MKDIYMQPSIMEMLENPQSLVRLMFLIYEFINFVMIALANVLFLFCRMCRANQLNIVKIEPKR